MDRSGREVWKPLQSEDFFRLFTLWRGQLPNVIEFELSEHQLDNVPEYKAISYVWGETGDAGVIESKDGNLALRQNLFSLLNVLCDLMSNGELNQQTYFWVDAICIHQEDLREKAQQVQRIGDIFGKATEVLVWQGTHPDEKGSCLEPFFRKTVKNPFIDRLVTHNYWNRMWIVQEFVLARKLVLFDDRYRIDNAAFEKQMRRNFSSPFDWLRNGIRGTPLSSVLHARWEKMRSRGPFQPELQAVVAEHRTKQCADPRDKVYALLSLCADASEVTVDYGISVACLFWRLIHGTAHSPQVIRNILESLQLEFAHLSPSLEKYRCLEHGCHDEHLKKSLIEDEEREKILFRLTFGYPHTGTTQISRVARDLAFYGENTFPDPSGDPISGKKYRILCGEVRIENFVVTSPQFNIVLLIERAQAGSSFDSRGRIVAVAVAKVLYEPAIEVLLSRPNLTSLLHCEITLEESQRRTCVVMDRKTLIAVLLLDAVLGANMPNCCQTIQLRQLHELTNLQDESENV